MANDETVTGASSESAITGAVISGTDSGPVADADPIPVGQKRPDGTPVAYRVRHMFAYDGRFYTRSNEAEVASLPDGVLLDKLSRGVIEKL